MKRCCDSRAKQKYDEIALGKSSNQAVQNTVKPYKGKESASPFVGLIGSLASEHDNLCDGDQAGSFGSLATKHYSLFNNVCDCEHVGSLASLAIETYGLFKGLFVFDLAITPFSSLKNDRIQKWLHSTWPMSQRFYRSHSVPLLAFGSSIQVSEYLIRRS